MSEHEFSSQLKNILPHLMSHGLTRFFYYPHLFKKKSFIRSALIHMGAWLISYDVIVYDGLRMMPYAILSIRGRDLKTSAECLYTSLAGLGMTT